MKRYTLLLIVAATVAAAQKLPKGNAVPSAPPIDARTQDFHDSKFGVRFNVPPGWELYREDGQVSTFHLDARTAPERFILRGAVSLDFNPYPDSVLSGATFYYSVETKTKDAECGAEGDDATPETATQDIAGVSFQHGHVERGGICVESRDEIYTTYRKGSCYRFDLQMNTFCSISSGAADLTSREIHSVEQRMADILSTVALDWKHAPPHPIPVPETVPHVAPTPPARTVLPTHVGQ